MQIASSSAVSTNYVNPADLTDANKSSALQTNLSNYQIIRRNGAVVPFEPAKIAVAMMKAFLAVHGTQGAASASVRETVDHSPKPLCVRSCAHAQEAALFILKTFKTKLNSGSCAAVTMKLRVPMFCTAKEEPKNVPPKKSRPFLLNPSCMLSTAANAWCSTWRACVDWLKLLARA